MDNNKSCNQGSCSEGKCCGITCPITGFNFSINFQFLKSAILMIVWVTLFSMFWHGNVMSGRYMETAQLWRPTDQMDFNLITIGNIIIGFFSAYIFCQGYKGTGVKEGLRFGILITLLFSGLALITSATQPIPASIIKMWVLGDFIMFSAGGIFLTLTCKKCC